MPHLTHPQGQYNQNLSLNVSENIDGPKFSVDLEVEKSSDIVLVKCPDTGYNHGSTGYKFTISDDVVKYKNLVPSNTSEFLWVPLLKKLSNLIGYSCGEITIKPDDVMSSMTETPNECHDGTENLLFVSKVKEDDTAVIIDPLDVKNPYTNQVFYYFIKPEENDERQIIEYCARYREYKNLAHFNLPYYSDNSTTNEIKKLILMNGLIDIENSTQQINSSFVIEGFDLVKLVYNHLDATGYKEVSQIYYFGPTSKNFTIEKYYDDHIACSFKPNCSLYFMNVGYLDKIIYNEREGSVDTLNSTVGIEGRFNITSDFIFFERKKDCACDCGTKLVCIYKTLDGTIAISNVYDHQTVVFHVNGYLDIPYDPPFLREDRIFRIPWTILRACIIFLSLLLAVVIIIAVKKFH